MIADASHTAVAARRSLPLDLGTLVRHIDVVLLAAAAALVAYGLWAIGGVTRFDIPGDPDAYVTRQAIAGGVGAFAMLVGFFTPLEVLRRHWKVIYVLTLALMVFTFLFAEAIRGSKRWIQIGPFQLQPSELGKVLFVIALAGFVASRRERIGDLRFVSTTIALALPPMLLVFLQPDLGTALVYAAALAAVLFIAGVRWRHVALLGGAGLFLAVAVVWLLPAIGLPVLKEYQVERLIGFTNPDADPEGLTYNVNQSITAIGAGGVDGRGVVEASQTRLDYLPEHATDFVFASFAEQRGFFGAAVLLLLYLLVVWRALRIVTISRDLYGAIVAGGLTFAFLFQVYVNVGMTMGVAPVTGIPLPFMTVGGSSMVANLLAIGVLQSIHARGVASLPRR